MATTGSGASRQGGKARAALRARIEARLEEIEGAALTRVGAIADPGEVADPIYAEGLRRAVSDALDYALEVIERGSGEHPLPVPVSLLAQARLAARNRVGVDTVLRRYFAGYTLLRDFLVKEAAQLDLPDETLRRLQHAQAAAFDGLLAAVSEEHARESDSSRPPAGRHRLRLVQRLLVGEPVDPTELRYPFETQHLGVVCLGPRAEDLLREIAANVDSSLLMLRANPDTVWAWLGGMCPLNADEFTRLAVGRAPNETAVAIGESAEGLAGWRLTHRQAAAALPIALRRPDRTARHRDVALAAAALSDDLLATSLRQVYLEPLERMRDGGKAGRDTLRAYFAADRSVSSAAAALGVNRATARNRLRAVEAVIERSLSSCAAELEVALRLQEIGT